jgi:hypothetical protein
MGITILPKEYEERPSNSPEFIERVIKLDGVNRRKGKLQFIDDSLADGPR